MGKDMNMNRKNTKEVHIGNKVIGGKEDDYDD